MKREIRAYPFDHEFCLCCGKNKSRRKTKSPAPVCLIAGKFYLALCMVCAKKISDSLDRAIERIQAAYAINLKG